MGVFHGTTQLMPGSCLRHAHVFVGVLYGAPSYMLYGMPSYFWTLQPELCGEGSLQRPKKVTIYGSDGCAYPFLCKPKDDLRKDARMMELMTAVNRMLHKSSSCRRRRLSVRCYSVVPLDQECGLIEWVPNMLQESSPQPACCTTLWF